MKCSLKSSASQQATREASTNPCCLQLLVISSESEKAQALAEVAVEGYAVETCVGPNAWNHAKSFQ